MQPNAGSVTAGQAMPFVRRVGHVTWPVGPAAVEEAAVALSPGVSAGAGGERVTHTRIC